MDIVGNEKTVFVFCYNPLHIFFATVPSRYPVKHFFHCHFSDVFAKGETSAAVEEVIVGRLVAPTRRAQSANVTLAAERDYGVRIRRNFEIFQ
jgi:hypothetical protein